MTVWTSDGQEDDSRGLIVFRIIVSPLAVDEAVGRGIRLGRAVRTTVRELTRRSVETEAGNQRLDVRGWVSKFRF
jgi:hypothetical protein